MLRTNDVDRYRSGVGAGIDGWGRGVATYQQWRIKDLANVDDPRRVAQPHPLLYIIFTPEERLQTN